MVSIDAQTIITALLLSATIVQQSFCSPIDCQHPGYLTTLQNEVRQFYTITSDAVSDDLVAQDSCTYEHGFQVGQPKQTVHTTDSWNSGMSTCPWVMHINTDMEGLRYPCRIATARLVLDNANDATSHSSTHHHPDACLRVQGSRHHRSDNKLCKGLQQTVPVVVNTGCRNGVYDYAIQNINITVGFTCTFVQ